MPTTDSHEILCLKIEEQKHTIRTLVSLVDALRQNASANMYQLATKKLNQLQAEGLIE